MVTLRGVSTADQTLASEIHGTALLLAQDETLQPLVDRLTEAAGDRADLRAEVAGTIAGLWFAEPDGQKGHELIAAGLLILAGAIDRREVARWVDIGFQRGRGSTQSYDPSR